MSVHPSVVHHTLIEEVQETYIFMYSKHEYSSKIYSQHISYYG